MSTKIEWANETWSPIVGCSKVSEGCRNCPKLRTARRLAEMPHTRSLYSSVTALSSGDDWNGHIGVADDRVWCKPLHWRKPRRIFVCSMGDLFHENVDSKTIDCVFAIMSICPQHTFQVLTKRPDRMAEYFCSPHVRPLPNVWLGVTAENQANVDERIPILLDTPAAVRVVSCEPMLGPIDIGMSVATCDCCDRWPSRWVSLNRRVTADLMMLHRDMVAERGVYRATSNKHGALSVDTPGGSLGIKPAEFDCLPGLDWVICGGESGPGARHMDPDWARSLRDQCQAAGVPFFVKQMSGRTKHERENIPPDLMIREFPGGGE